jgi:hypothetical protein
MLQSLALKFLNKQTFSLSVGRALKNTKTFHIQQNKSF